MVPKIRVKPRRAFLAPERMGQRNPNQDDVTESTRLQPRANQQLVSTFERLRVRGIHGSLCTINLFAYYDVHTHHTADSNK